jgi:hypothetical protein
VDDKDKYDQAQHRREEQLKLYFECFKYQATLAVATAVVFLALYQAIRVPFVFMIGPMGLLVVSVVLSSMGMYGVAEEIGKATHDATRGMNARGWRSWTRLPFLVQTCVSTFLAAFSVFIVAALFVG